MAKRKRRKSAGPPPAPQARRAAATATGERPAKPKRRPGEPVPPSFKGVLIRAAIVAAIFYPYLIYVVGETPGAALLVSVIAFGLMIPLGMFLDRFRYRRQLRRWEERRAGSSGR